MYLMTDSLACGFVRGQAGYMREQGFDVTIVSSPGPGLDRTAHEEDIGQSAISMKREIAPLADFKSFLQLLRLFRRTRPHILNAGTMKAALLGMTAAWLTRVPVRIYTLHGLRLETTQGTKRRILHFAERWITLRSHRIFCVSPSLKQTYVCLVPQATQKATVLADGSCNGVDAGRFEPAASFRKRAAELRRSWNIDKDDQVIGFVGRLVRDKGVEELVDAFDRIRVRHPDAWLVLLGDFESGDPVSDACEKRLRDDPRVILPGFVDEPIAYYFLMDVFVLPSYREGLPSVSLEAALAEVPVVGFRSTGVVDSVLDGKTGRLVEQGDVLGLADAIAGYLDDPALARAHGEAGRAWVLEAFRPETIWAALRDEYVRLLEAASCPRPQSTR